MTTNFWNQTRACARSVHTVLNSVSTQFFSASTTKIFNKMCLMLDLSDICGAQFLYTSHPLHLPLLCTRALSSILLFIAGPSEPPRLLILIIILIAYIQADSSSSFSTGEESQQKRKGTGPNYREAHVFLRLREAAKVSSCAVPRSSSKLLRSSSAAVRAAAWCCYWEAESAEGEGSRAQRAVPRAASNEFMFRAKRKDDFAVTLFCLRVSVESWQCWQMGI